MKIDSYEFGRIVVGGKAYTSDVIVFSDDVRANWWRKEGHSLHPEDLAEVVARKPSKVIMGCGASSILKVPASTRAWLHEKGVELVALDTSSAVREYNASCEDPSAVGCFHLTC